MSSVINKTLSIRGKLSLEEDSDSFDKSLNASIHKAISQTECAVKEKHARIVIIASHKERTGKRYWKLVQRLPLLENQLIAWKFCYVTHKLTRDGHPNALRDSIRFKFVLNNLMQMWVHMSEGYGKLICSYAKFIVQKLSFHEKYPQIPGNLLLEDEAIDKICSNDINNYFELSVDMLDLMEDLLRMQNYVFNSMDMSRSNSMTSSGQCRLAPFILCIQDSCQLYHFLVQILFRLHSSLPADTLTGHRDRFYKQFRNLKDFYQNTQNLQYFKNLIKVPILPENAPNFLRSCELSSHIKPMALLPPEPEPIESEPDFADNFVSDLVDTKDEIFENGAMALEKPKMDDEKDSLIRQLTWEVNQLKGELSRMKAEDQMVMESLHNRIRDLEMETVELRQINESTTQENELLKSALKDSEMNVSAQSKLNTAEKMVKVNEDKFSKMKDIYTKLREEHVQLLKMQSDANKKLIMEKRDREEMEIKLKNQTEDFQRLKSEQGRVEEQLVRSSNAAIQLAEIADAKNNLDREKQELEKQFARSRSDFERKRDNDRTKNETEMVALESQITNLEKSLGERETENLGLISRIERLTNRSEEDLKTVSDEKMKLISDYERKLSALNEESERASSDAAASNVKNKTELEERLSKRTNDLISKDRRLNDMNRERERMASEKRKLVDGVLEKVISGGEGIIGESITQLEDVHHSNVKSTAEYLLTRIELTKEALIQFNLSYQHFQKDETSLDDLARDTSIVAHYMSEVINFAFATARSANIEPGEELSSTSKCLGEKSKDLIKLLNKDSQQSKYSERLASVTDQLTKMSTQCVALIPVMDDVDDSKVVDMVDEELRITTQAIEQAAARLAEMMASSKNEHSGIQLEVNERIIDSCNTLMQKIKQLIEKSKLLQREIMAQGRGTSSIKEFYKKNHRWTEGLISAAKAVGFGANILVEAADKVVTKDGKFEELMVCAQEISASTTQLVVASKVKADRGSTNLRALANASKEVSVATGQVVASAKSGADRIEDIDTMDFSKLTLHQAKRNEMNSQVRVIELESLLEKERTRLANLRKTHYQLAGEVEGWDQSESQK